MKKYWFKSKCFRYGFQPVTVEGWIVIVLFCMLILWAAYANGFFSGYITIAQWFHFFFELFCFFSAFILLFKSKVEDGFKRKNFSKKESKKNHF
ncbi:MAG: hypothetical protein CR972_02195 [Candidatus Moraniibacteriota bacterium]|nr:MAG: hypothetical protein CR972_02195 [Candidatus Moranbacteria bacterium]